MCVGHLNYPPHIVQGLVPDKDGEAGRRFGRLHESVRAGANRSGAPLPEGVSSPPSFGEVHVEHCRTNNSTASSVTSCVYKNCVYREQPSVVILTSFP